MTEDNEIMRRTLAVDIAAFLQEIKGDLSLFKARSKGSFDYRANVIAAFVARKIKYTDAVGAIRGNSPTRLCS